MKRREKNTLTLKGKIPNLHTQVKIICVEK